MTQWRALSRKGLYADPVSPPLPPDVGKGVMSGQRRLLIQLATKVIAATRIPTRTLLARDLLL